MVNFTVHKFNHTFFSLFQAVPFTLHTRLESEVFSPVFRFVFPVGVVGVVGVDKSQTLPSLAITPSMSRAFLYKSKMEVKTRYEVC